MKYVLFAAITAVLLTATAFAQIAERVLPTGLVFAPPSEVLKVPRGSLPLTGLLPPSVDLSSDFPEPGDQGQQGSCVGWSVAALKSYQERVERNWDWNDSTLFSPSYIYNHVKLSPDCESGAFFTTALIFVQSSGAAARGAFPYSPAVCSRLATADERNSALPFRIADYARIDPADPFEMKGNLAARRPVLIGMTVDRAFMNLGRSIYQGLVGPVEAGHAMVVVGYDDALGAYKVINSWGTDWSHDGFGWISYAVFPSGRNTVREAYVATDVSNALTANPVAPPPPLKPTGTDRTVLVVYRRPVVAGTRSEVTTTRDHHCSVNCAGEPTRTPYTLSMTAKEGRLLQNPKLICEGAACPWSAISYVRLQELGTKVEAGWSVWGHPTTWRLEAEEYELQDYKQERRRVAAGTTIHVTPDPGDGDPVVSTIVNSKELRVGPALNAAGAGIFYVGREERQGAPRYTFTIDRP